MKLVRNSFYTLTSSVIPLVVSIATLPFFVTQIGAERYGALAIAWLLLGYFGAADFGIGRAIIQRIAAMQTASDAERAGAVWSALLSIAGLAALTTSLLYLFALWYFREVFQIADGARDELVRAVWLLALCNPVVAINGVLAGSLMGLERFRLVALSNTIANSGMLIFPLAVAYLISVDLTYLIAASLSARLLGGVIVGVSVWRTMLIGHPVRLDRGELSKLANFGLWVMLSALVGPLMLFADRFLIGALYDAVAVAAYAIPYQIAFRTLIFPNAITNALFPRFAAEEAEASRKRCAQFAVMIGQVFAPVVIVLVCLAGPLLDLWLGAVLDPRSVPVAQLILVGCWTNAIALVPFSYLQARGYPRFTAILHVAELPVFLLLLWALGAQFGLTGFAAAFALRCLGDCVALMVRAGVAGFSTVTLLLAPAILIALAMVAGSLLTDPLALLACGAVLAFGSLICIVWQMPHPLRARFVKMPYAGGAFAKLWG